MQAIKGMNDVRPDSAEPFLDSAIWRFLFTAAEKVLSSYGYTQVWLPVVEDTALFARGIGEGTDIVAKEMYTFSDRGGRSLTLRPEGTAGSVRSYIENNLGRTDAVQKWWYAGPMFRAERPQKGRYRQFYQIGAEFFGVSDAMADAETLVMLSGLCGALGLKDVRVRVNSLGDKQSRVNYRELLQGYLRGHLDALCDSCKERFPHNPLRVLDCKRESCRAVVANAPDIQNALTDAARAHFDRVLSLVGALGVAVERDPRLVRGLDYYTGTIFEFTTQALGAQDAILGGGRYDDLVADLGGPATPAIGFAAGVERLALLLAGAMGEKVGPHLYVAPMPGAEIYALRLAEELRRDFAFKIEVDVSLGKLKQQMKRADKIGARAVLVLGEDELKSGSAKPKDLRGGMAELKEVAITAPALGAWLLNLPVLTAAGKVE